MKSFRDFLNEDSDLCESFSIADITALTNNGANNSALSNVFITGDVKKLRKYFQDIFTVVRSEDTDDKLKNIISNDYKRKYTGYSINLYTNKIDVYFNDKNCFCVEMYFKN
jgi:hypothetical protein